MINIIATRAQAVYDGDIRTIALCDIAAELHIDDAMIGRLGLEAAHALCDMSPGAALAELYADVMTEDDISRWWGDGGHIEDTRDLVIVRGLRCHPLNRLPTEDDVRAARVRIASAIIADHRASQRITAGIASLADDVPPGWVHATDRSILRWKLVAVVAAIAIVGLAIVEAM